MSARDATTSAPAPAAERLHWPLILALGITTIVGYGTTFYAFALLLTPAPADLGLAREAAVGAFTLAMLVSGVCAPVVGQLIDRVGGRAVMTAGSLMAAALLALLSRAASALDYYVAWSGLGVAMACTLYEPSFAVITAVHRAGARRAITLLTLLGGFASTVFWPLGQFMIDRLGWRGACLGFAAAQLAVCAPLHGLVIPPRARRPAATTPLGGAPAGTAVSDALRNPVFYWLAGAYVAQSTIFASVAVHFIAMLRAKGMSASQAAAIGAMIGPMQVAGRMLELTVARRLSIGRMGSAAMVLLPAAMIVLLLAPASFPVLAAVAALYGAGNGIMTIVRGALPAVLFGVERYASIAGALAAPSLLATALAPLLVSAAWSASGGYERVYLLLATVGLGGVVCFAVVLRRLEAARRNSTAA